MTKPSVVARRSRIRRPLAWAMIAGAGILLAGCSSTPATDTAATGTAAAPASAAGAGSTARQTAAAPEKDPAVIDRMKQMSAYLRSLKAFQVTSLTTIDEVMDTGQKIQFGGVVGYRFVAPDKLRAFVRSDRVWRDFYYDGKTLTQVAPRMNYYASVPATGNVGSVLTRVLDDYDIDMPLADLFTWGTTDDSVGRLSSAIRVGPSFIDGVECDHFALRQDGVDWQVWVQKGDQPLPRKMVITTTDEAQQPQYTANLVWFTSIRPRPAEFTYTPTQGAMRITQVPTRGPQGQSQPAAK